MMIIWIRDISGYFKQINKIKVYNYKFKYNLKTHSSISKKKKTFYII